MYQYDKLSDIDSAENKVNLVDEDDFFNIKFDEILKKLN